MSITFYYTTVFVEKQGNTVPKKRVPAQYGFIYINQNKTLIFPRKKGILLAGKQCIYYYSKAYI